MLDLFDVDVAGALRNHEEPRLRVPVQEFLMGYAVAFG
jgi:hypothetical protein